MPTPQEMHSSGNLVSWFSSKKYAGNKPKVPPILRFIQK
jgi:hypothetical protein